MNIENKTQTYSDVHPDTEHLISIENEIKTSIRASVSNLFRASVGTSVTIPVYESITVTVHNSVDRSVYNLGWSPIRNNDTNKMKEYLLSLEGFINIKEYEYRK
jgi:hypothetical protein